MKVDTGNHFLKQAHKPITLNQLIEKLKEYDGNLPVLVNGFPALDVRRESLSINIRSL